ncbi:hypothetical protein ACLKMY_00570 [Paraburkholderia mimosarum]|uniref:hypothetical protein n=1 Tax=Paraburkholderia mimosarum TaxID=312026 RepID=UPI0039C0EAC4
MIAAGRCCARCSGARKIENAIGNACKFALAMPQKPWDEWLDAPFVENDCEYFSVLSPAELARREAKRRQR